ncbi:MAG: HEAT repeat domain-containing protein [Elusimicrobiota bacterium]|jgi:hypothetical protein
MADTALLFGVILLFGTAGLLLYVLAASFGSEEPEAAARPAADAGVKHAALREALREAWRGLFPQPQAPRPKAVMPPLPGMAPAEPRPGAAPPPAAGAAPSAAEVEALSKLQPFIKVLESKTSGRPARKDALQSAADLLQGVDNAVRVRLYELLPSEELRKLVLKITAFQADDLGRMLESAQEHTLQAAILERVSQTRGMPAGLVFDLVKRARDPAVQERLYDFIASRDPAFFDERVLLEAFACAKSPGMKVRCALKILSGAGTMPLPELAGVLEGIADTEIAGSCFAAIVGRDPKFFPPEKLSIFTKPPAGVGLRAEALRHLTEFYGKGLAELPASALVALAEDPAEQVPVRCLALARLGRTKEVGKAGVMGRLASESREPALARAAALALGDLGSPEACKVLLSLFASKEPSRRTFSAEALRRTASDAALDAVFGVLASDEDRAASERLVRVAAAIERNRSAAGLPPRAKGVLVDLLAKNPAGVVAADAAEALGELKAVEALPLLLERCDSPDEAVREQALTALGRLGVPDEAVLKRLKAEWQEGASFGLRRAAEAALKALAKGKAP